MSINRQDFIRLLGLALASLALARCGGNGLFSSTPQGRLRRCWTQFDELAENVRFNAKIPFPQESGNNAKLQELLDEHRAALDELVTSDTLSAGAADLLHEAYSATVYHIWRSNANITCYEPMIVNYAPASAQSLVDQSAALDEMADSSQIDPATVAQVQQAIAHDLAYVSLTDEEENALEEHITNSMQVGGMIPQFGELELESGPEVTEAAAFLVALFIGADS